MIEIRLKIPLERKEYSALLKVASEELRNPVDQLRFILRQELDRRGLLEHTIIGSANDDIGQTQENLITNSPPP